MQKAFDDHKIDRLHLKTGMQVDKDTIAVIGRGKPENVKQQIIGLILYFKPEKGEDGKWKIDLVRHQTVHASVFPRQLDFIQKIRDKLVLTSDTSDEDQFEAFSISMSDRVKRNDGNQKMLRHIFGSN